MFSAKSTLTHSLSEPENQIMEQIALVKNAFSKLQEMDKKLAVPVTLGVYYWLRSNAGLIDIALACVGGAYTLSFSPKERHEYAVNFKHELKRLLILYQAYAQGGVRVTHDDVFLSALETLAPFIAATNELLPKGFTEAPIENISTKFITLLAQPPHQLALLTILNRQRSASGFIANLTHYFYSFFANDSRSNTQNVSLQTPSIYQQLVANSKMKLYGFQSREQLTEQANSIADAAVKIL